MEFFPIFLILSGFAQAQFIQHWDWQNGKNAQGNWVPTPFWRPETHMPYMPVLFPPGNVVLEYNCHKMPAICQNVMNWHNDNAKSKWSGKWQGWFTWDLGQSSTRRDCQAARRKRMCPDTWKGTINNPRCPELNQPRIVPPWYNTNGVGVTALAPQPLGATEVYLRIADGKSSSIPGVGRTQPSGRVYSCDEFPPASWVEGGVGVVGQNVQEGDGGPGTTYCAPLSQKCGTQYDAIGSEQNWQGFVHSYLGRQLVLELKDAAIAYSMDSGVAFRFEYFSSPNELYAARVLWDESNTRRWKGIHPGISFRRGVDHPTRSATHFIPTGNGTLAIQLPNGEIIHTHEQDPIQRAVKRVTELKEMSEQPFFVKLEESTVPISNKTEFPKKCVVPQSLHLNFFEIY